MSVYTRVCVPLTLCYYANVAMYLLMSRNAPFPTYIYNP